MEIAEALETIHKYCVSYPGCKGCVVDKEDDLDEHMCMLAMRPSLWKLDKIKSAMPSPNNARAIICINSICAYCEKGADGRLDNCPGYATCKQDHHHPFTGRKLTPVA